MEGGVVCKTMNSQLKVILSDIERYIPHLLLIFDTNEKTSLQKNEQQPIKPTHPPMAEKWGTISTTQYHTLGGYTVYYV